MIQKEDESIEIQIVLPKVDNDEVSRGLRLVTRLIHRCGLTDSFVGIGLGGLWGYGVDFECKSFMLHHYCWCESNDCPWCAGCSCPESLWTYLLDGRVVSFKEKNAFTESWYYGPGGFDAWLKRGGEVATPHGTKEYERQAARTETVKDPDQSKWCRVCRGEFGGAPNFLHKPSGSAVSWYKYIGRDMEVNLKAEWRDIMRECVKEIRSLSAPEKDAT